MKRISILLMFTLCSLPVFATTESENISEIKAQLLSLLQRVELLEAENQQLRSNVEENTVKVATASQASASSMKSWTDTLKIKGDFRYRYENIDAERSNSRERNRVRARVAAVATPTDNLEVGIGISSGGDDPVSTNQTLGGGASTKDVRLDLAYFKWQAKPGLTLIGGKMKNVWHRTGGNGLLWDGDYRPEGLALTYESDHLFVNSSLNFLESDSSRDNTRISYGLQAGYNGQIGDNKIRVGASYFDIGAEGRQVFFGDVDEFFGNTFVCPDLTDLSSCVYNHDYQEVELFAEMTANIGEMPVFMFANYVQNQDADDLDTGWATGFKLGKASGVNTWELGYTYQNLEANAVFALLVDSNFGGGGTDAKGHIVQGSYAVNKKWKLTLTYFANERNVDIGREEDYDRIILDTAFKF